MTTTSLRKQSKTVRSGLTQAFHNSYVQEYGTAPDSEAYRALTNQTYQIVLGGTADSLRAKLGVPAGESLREYLSDKELYQLAEAENALTQWLAAGYSIQRCLTALWQTNQKRN